MKILANDGISAIGKQLLEDLREKKLLAPHSIFMLVTGENSVPMVMSAVELEPDDYLVKPFDLAELWARVQVLAGRRLQQSYQLALGNITLNKHTQQVICAGQIMPLKPIAFQLLSILLEAAPRPVSRSELCSKIWGDEPTESDALRSHLYQLRKTLQQHGAAVVLETVHGVGFVIKAGAN